MEKRRSEYASVNSYRMSRIRGKDTAPEIALRRELWKRGHRYRTSMTAIVGKPDIVFVRAKVAVFCDGDFWHGKLWVRRKKTLRVNRGYWLRKIEGNMRRDRRIGRQLRRSGWEVVRLWESDIAANLDACVAEVERSLASRRAPGGNLAQGRCAEHHLI